MRKNSLVEGTFIATFAIMFSKFLGIIYVIPFYAIIGTQGGALYAYSYNIYLVFLGLTTAGLPIAISKLVSEYNTLEMYEAKERTYTIAKNVTLFISIISFLVLFVFAEEFAYLMIGELQGGNTIADVALTVRAVSFCLLIAPFISIMRGYLQGHKFIKQPSISQVIEQIVRIIIILTGSYTVINVFHGSIATAVGISVFSAFVAGVAAYIYLKVSMYKNKNQIIKHDKLKRDNVRSREIAKKILMYSIPLIIVAVAINVYAIIDMALINRGMYYLGYSAKVAETVSSIISTWAAKICMIISAIATGLSISLIPHITSSFVKKDMKKVNEQLNRSIQMALVTSIPMAVGLAILSKPVYTLFFGQSEYGPMILSVAVFVAVLSNIHIVALMAFQALNRYKMVYVATFTGFILNALLDIPLMILFDKIGLLPFFGALAASLIGYATTIAIGLISAKRQLGLNYNSTWKVLLQMIIPIVAMIIVLLILNLFIPINSTNIFTMLWVVVLYTIIGSLIYIIIMYKTKVLNKVFGDEMVNKILRKLKLKKND